MGDPSGQTVLQLLDYHLQSNVLEITPPLIIEEKELAEALEILENAISDVENHRVSDDTIRNFQGW